MDLSEADVEELGWNHDAFVREIIRALGTTGPVVERELGCLELGALRRATRSHQVMLSFRGHMTVRALLAERLNGGRRTLLLVPTRLGIGPELEEKYGPGTQVVLGFLDDLLEVREGKLEMGKDFEALLSARDDAEAEREATANTRGWLCDNDGLREISEEEAQEFAQRRAEYDFFVDAMHADMHGDYVVGRRGLDGKPVCRPVSRTLANGLAELVLRTGPVAVESMVAFRALRDPVVAMQRARRAVDIKVGDCWRSIVSLPGPGDGRHWYMFKKSADVSFAVLFRAVKAALSRSTDM